MFIEDATPGTKMMCLVCNYGNLYKCQDCEEEICYVCLSDHLCIGSNENKDSSDQHWNASNNKADVKMKSNYKDSKHRRAEISSSDDSTGNDLKRYSKFYSTDELHKTESNEGSVDNPKRVTVPEDFLTMYASMKESNVDTQFVTVPVQFLNIYASMLQSDHGLDMVTVPADLFRKRRWSQEPQSEFSTDDSLIINNQSFNLPNASNNGETVEENHDTVSPKSILKKESSKVKGLETLAKVNFGRKRYRSSQGAAAKSFDHLLSNELHSSNRSMNHTTFQSNFPKCEKHSSVMNIACLGHSKYICKECKGHELCQLKYVMFDQALDAGVDIPKPIRTSTPEKRNVGKQESKLGCWDTIPGQSVSSMLIQDQHNQVIKLRNECCTRKIKCETVMAEKGVIGQNQRVDYQMVLKHNQLLSELLDMSSLYIQISKHLPEDIAYKLLRKQCCLMKKALSVDIESVLYRLHNPESSSWKFNLGLFLLFITLLYVYSDIIGYMSCIQGVPHYKLILHSSLKSVKNTFNNMMT